MRILSIRLRNLNSLTGEWNINLDAPEYAGNGLFAITGPTGAGKSTILDAVCLALYGCTPRLGKISRGSNEIMSRQAADCLAEVVFETPEGRWRCCWSHKKARGKSGGKLQEPRHEIFDHNQGLCLTRGMTEARNKVEELTGMNFERFTQSVVLAQGSFAAFLLSSGDKRAPLLEQITGTEIYAEISRRVFQRNKAEGENLEKLRASLKQLPLLSTEEESELREKVRRFDVEKAKLSAQKDGVDQALTQRRLLEELHEELNNLRKLRESWQTDTLNFADSAARLKAHHRALPVQGSLAAVQAKRAEQLKDEKAAEEAQTSLPGLEAAVDSCRERCNLAVQAREEEKQAQATLAQELEAMRALDRELQHLTREDAANRDRLKKTVEDFEKAETEAHIHGKELQDSRDALKALCEEKETRAQDATLSEVLPGMWDRHRLLLQQEKEQSDRELRIREYSAELEAQKKEAARLTESHAVQCRLEQELQEKHRNLTAEKTQLLEGRSASLWRDEKESLLTSADTLREARTLLIRYVSLTQKESEGRMRAAELERKREKQNATLAATRGELSLTRRALEVEQKALRFAERIINFAKEREKLCEGAPCPLCGSLSHPYAAELPAPHIDEHEAEAQRLADRENTLSRSVRDSEIRLAELEKDAQHTQETLQDTAGELLKTGEHLAAALRTLAPSPAMELTPDSADVLVSGRPEAAVELSAMLEQAEAKNSGRLALVSEVLKRLESTEQALGHLRDAEEEIQKEREKADLALRQITEKCLETQAGLNTLEQERQRALSFLEELGGTLQRDLSARGIIAADSGERGQALNALESRRKDYAALLSREQALRDTLRDQDKRQALDEERRAIAARQREAQRQICADSAAACARAEALRRDRFGDKDADTEEARMKARIEEREKEEAQCRKAFDEAKRSHEAALHLYHMLEKHSEERRPELEREEKALLQALTAAGFSSAEECRSALLPAEEARTLDERQRDLEQQGAHLTALETDKNTLWEEAQKKAPDKERTELEALQEKLSLSLEKLLQERGAMDEKLRRSEEQRLGAQKLGLDIAKQEKICERWSSLNELIGSAEGGKFRKYAQGLTFRTLINQANRQLALLTDRYVLVPNRENTLELDVIDRYQADAVRSSRNLSGGESFIVSLSLALGLAQMASRKVRVDSVFLDEGFGTLDEEALDTALAMLSSLRQRGKVIGLISHVQSLKDRIDTRIEVTPLHNGCSLLSGPGVTGSGTWF